VALDGAAFLSLQFDVLHGERSRQSPVQFRLRLTQIRLRTHFACPRGDQIGLPGCACLKLPLLAAVLLIGIPARADRRDVVRTQTRIASFQQNAFTAQSMLTLAENNARLSREQTKPQIDGFAAYYLRTYRGRVSR
jgi:hypothetical protein